MTPVKMIAKIPNIPIAVQWAPIFTNKFFAESDMIIYFVVI